MKKILIPILSLFIVNMFVSCTQKVPTSEEIQLSWEIISNTATDKAVANSKFTIVNNSKFNFNESNWALYFNIAPRTPLACDNNVEIKFINGDWFKMVPKENFELKAGSSIEIKSDWSEWLIKESDAPLGPYFVFYDKKGNETGVVPVTQYTIAPFTRAEHAHRHKNDKEPIPTAQWQFDNNAALSELGNDELMPIIPNPVSYKATGNKVVFNEPVDLLYENGLKNEAQFIADFLGTMFGMSYSIQEANAPKANSIYLGTGKVSVSGIADEAYKLEIKKDKSIIITGNKPAGVFYGIQSLISMLPVEIFRGVETEVVLDEVVITDAPRFEYRGFQLDVARNFQTKESVKKVIDILSFYKGNYLLLYITEDEGWRLAIEELPELTEVGAQRAHTSKGKEASTVHPAYGSGPFAYEEGKHGSGFYTREDFIELLQYAQQRHVNIIPEVNFPGHSRAAIKAMEARYEKFMAEGNEEKANEFRLIDPEDKSVYRSAQWYTDNIVNVARESTYKFYETVIDDIIEMYQEADVELEYFHTGGDEVPEGSWSESPMCKELMKTLPGITDPKNLQAYFFRRAVEILERKNLKIGGWEEVALLKEKDGTYVANPEFADKNVYPYVWNNLGVNTDLAYRMANAGYPIIMCNVSNFYFDLAYNKDPREAGLYWAGFVHTRDAWQVAPFDVFKTTTHTSMGREIDQDAEYAGLEQLKAEAQKNIIGVEAQLWSETVKGSEMMQHYLLPKLVGFAESAWAKERKWETIADKAKREALMDKEWNVFANTLAKKDLPRLKGLYGGFNYRVPTPGAKIIDGKLHANSTFPGLIIRYTTDGSEPTNSSTVYKEPVLVSGKVVLKAFDSAGKESLPMEVK